MKTTFRLAAVLCVALALAGCWRWWPDVTYRYKLTLSVNTPDGVKTASNVVEIDYWKFAQGTPHTARGQALYLDLGPGRRPLVALLTHIPRQNERVDDLRWLEFDPIRLIARLCLHMNRIATWIDAASQFKECRGAYPLEIADLPDIVTFTDTADPKSVLLVDPNDLTAPLGPSVSWQSMTMELTSDPLTKGIEKRLPWLTTLRGNQFLDGSILGQARDSPIANQLQRYDFKAN